MDFITKLPKSKDLLIKTEYDSIFIVVDRLLGFRSFEPYLESSDSKALVYSLIRNVFLRFDTP